MRPLPIRYLLASTLLIAACGGSGPEVIGPGNHLQVTNATDDFQFQVTGLTNVQQVLRYNWVITGDSASINQASAVTGGTATLTIRDANGAIVYQSGLEANGTYHSAKSVSGTWKIEVRMDLTDGDLNFRVQKAP